MNSTVIRNAELFGLQLKKCREIAKLTQEDLAEKIDRDPSLISHYERGKGLPDSNRLERMISYLKEHGASRDSLEKLREYYGHSYGEITSNRFLSQFSDLLNDLEDNQPARLLLEETLMSILQDWEKYRGALRDLKRSYCEDAQLAFSGLQSLLKEELPLRRRLLVLTLQGLANSWRYLGEPIKGLEYLDEGIKLAEEMGDQEKEELARLLLDRGNFHRRLNNWELAKKDYIKSRQVFKMVERTTNESQDRFIAMVERKLAGTLLFQGQPLKALEHINRSIQVCRELLDIEEECKGLQHRAWSLALLGNWDEALNTHKDVLETIQNFGVSRIFLAKSQMYLADSYRVCGILEKAIGLYDDAHHNLQQHLKGRGEVEGDYLVYGTILLGKGAAYRVDASKWDMAKPLLEKSLQCHIQLKAKLHEALTRSEIGCLAIALGDFNKAKYELEKAKETFDILGNDFYSIAQLIHLAELYYRKGSLSEARANATTAMSLSDKFQYDVHSVRARLELATINISLPSEQKPLELYLAALQKAHNLNIFLV